MTVEVARNGDAQRLLSDRNFRAEWETLCDRCPWATAFQSCRFASVWYSVHAQEFEPVLLTSRRADGSLQGLLALARSRADGSLIVAGGRHAEYQSWICEPELAERFPAEALARVRQEFPAARLTFQYLPAQIPTSWLRNAPISQLCLLREHRRPVWELGDGQGIAASLKKSSNKNRLRHLKKLGDFEFRRLADPREFEQLFDEMIELYDLRHGAVHGSLPFCSVEHQKEIHSALFREPGLLHATVMRAGGRLVAAHFGVCGKGEVHFGTIVHDPRLARHSPGKLQYLLLAQMLQKEGFRRADLTPGGDPYKERHATTWDTVHTLTMMPTIFARARAAAGQRGGAVIKAILKRRGMTVVDARNRVRRLGGPARAISTLVRCVRAWLYERQETRLYARELASEYEAGHLLPEDRAGDSQPVVRVDAWRDLLAYVPTRTGPCRQSFLSGILARLEAGEHAYTVTDADRLVHLSWMAPPGSDAIAADLAGLAMPPDTVLVQDSDVFDRAASPQARAAALRTILRDAQANPSARRAMVLVQATTADHALLQNAGFVYGGSIWRTTRLGRCSVRSTGVTLPLASPPSPRVANEARPESRLPAVESSIRPASDTEVDASARPRLRAMALS